MEPNNSSTFDPDEGSSSRENNPTGCLLAVLVGAIVIAVVIAVMKLSGL